MCHFYRLQRNGPVNLPFSALTHFPILTKQSLPASPDVVMGPVCSTAWIALSRTRRACDFYGLRRNGPGNPRYCFSSLLACQSDKRPGPDISLSWEITRWKFSSQDPHKRRPSRSEGSARVALSWSGAAERITTATASGWVLLARNRLQRSTGSIELLTGSIVELWSLPECVRLAFSSRNRLWDWFLRSLDRFWRIYI